MRLFQLAPVVALVTLALAAPSPSAAAPKDVVDWIEGVVTAVSVNTDGTLDSIGLQPYGNEQLRTFAPCTTTRVADHPEILEAMFRLKRLKVKSVNGCFTKATLFN